MELYNGDCLGIVKKIKDKTIDLVVIDPPYNVKINHDGGKLYKNKGMEKSQQDVSNAKIDNGYDIEELNKELIRVMKEINIYIWCNKAQIMEYLDFYVTRNKCKFDILTWNKTNPLPTYSNKYVNDVEYILYFHKGKGHCFPECYTDAFHYYLSPINSIDKKKYKHPTIKPLEFTKRLIRNSSKKNNLVLDCFMGSGTTGVACKELERDFIGVEINKEFFDIAVERINSVGKTEQIGIEDLIGE